MKTNGLFLCVLASLIVGAVLADTFTTTLTASAMATVFAGNKTCGKCTQATVSSAPQSAALIKWDLSGLPSDADITVATITLHISGAGSDLPSIEAFEAAGAWQESAISNSAGASALTGDPTWELQSYPTTIWAAGEEGGKDPSASVFESPLNSNAPGDSSLEGGFSGSVVLNLVKGWKTTPASNFGISVQLHGSDTGTVFFGSRHNTDATIVPTLELTYNSALGAPPPPVVPQTFTNPYVGVGVNTGLGARVPSRYSANNTSGAVIGGVIGGIAALMIIVAIATIILRS